MKITYIHQHFAFPEEPGGSRPWEFARRLAGDGHRVTLICGGNEELHTVRENVRIVRIKTPYANEMGFIQRLASFARFMALSTLQSARTKTDLVFASSTPLTVAVPGIISSRVRRVPLVFEVRDLWPEAPVALGIIKNPILIGAAKLLERAAYKASGVVIALSPSMAAGVQRAVPNTVVRMVPNSADVASFRRTKEEIARIRRERRWADKFVVTYCGSFGRIYDLPWLIEVAAELRNDGVMFQMVGAGALSDELRALAGRSGLDPNEIFLGKRSKAEVAEIFAASDVVVSALIDNPTLEGSSLNKAFDAMAAGRPMIFNHGGWLATIMSTAGAGWVLDRDPAIAAKSLRNLANDPDAIKTASEASSLLGENNYSRDHQYERFREALLETRREARATR